MYTLNAYIAISELTFYAYVVFVNYYLQPQISIVPDLETEETSARTITFSAV